MNFSKNLQEIGLDAESCVVIGSGILSANNIRESSDIDVTVTEDTYKRLSEDTRFTEIYKNGRKVLVDEIFEIGTNWGVLGKNQVFDDLYRQSVVIDDVRYVTLEFLLAVKESWLDDDDVRQKDIDDVKLIKTFLN